MKLDAIKEIARQLDIKPGKAKKNELIRSIQVAEGNIACYNSGVSADCGQPQCLWREDCV